MKRLFAILVGATVLAAPLAQAQAQSRWNEPPRREMRDDRRQPDIRRPPVQVKRWQRGERLHAGVSRQMVGPRDIRRYGLPLPRRGEQWVRVNNQFLLISANSGVIIRVANAR